MLESNEYPQLVICDEVDSTQDELRRLLAQGQASNNQAALAVMARTQTAGRGRLGRSWVSLPGSLYLSIALALPEYSVEVASLSLIVGLAVYEVLEDLTGSQQVIKLKWPNDLVCPKGKLAGILVELNQTEQKPQHVIIGLGVNTQRPQSGASERAAYLSDLSDITLGLEQLAELVIKSIMDYAHAWQAAEYSFAGFRDEYNARLSLSGQEVGVRNRLGQILAEGVVAGVDESGLLLIQSGDGSLAKVSSGEVTLR